MAPNDYLTPANFVTRYDNASCAKKQEQYAADLGARSHTILIDSEGAWFAYLLNGGMVAGAEIIGRHANTADLLKGFLSSGASLVVKTFENGQIQYHCIKQCIHPATINHICPVAVFDLNLLAPIWRQTTQEQYDHYLNCVPPTKYASNGFLTGEPYTHNQEGQAVSLAFKKVRQGIFAQMMTNHEFVQTGSFLAFPFG